MLGFEWSALRVGDHVVVHDDLDPGLVRCPGIVKVVQTRFQDANEVTIRLAGPPSRLVRPRRQAVHLVPLDRRRCWRCDAIGSDDADRSGQQAAA